MTDNDPFDALRLSLVSGLGPKLTARLLEAFGTASEVFETPPGELAKLHGISQAMAKRIVESDPAAAEAQWELCKKLGLKILPRGGADYPDLLEEIADPPALLFYRGTIRAAEPCVGIVGTRHATRYGLAQAQRLAGGLARAGITVVSGLARGIDAAAHQGALENDGRTLAVLNGGLAKIYPPEHANLADEVAACGAVISERPPEFPLLKEGFAQRNRIISGLSLGTIVVEAPSRSGALITTTHAMEQNREVFAVPGRIDTPASSGCHDLIRDGAILCRHVDDVLEELEPRLKRLKQALAPASGKRDAHDEVAEAILPTLDGNEAAVYAALDADPQAIDQIIHRSGLPAHQVLAAISMLELKRLVRRESGGTISRR